jgi:hypothetical protein
LPFVQDVDVICRRDGVIWLSGSGGDIVTIPPSAEGLAYCSNKLSMRIVEAENGRRRAP